MSRILAITINPGLAIIGVLPVGQPNVAFNFQFEGYGGSLPYTYAPVGGLPGTFDLSSSGELAGEYSGAGDFPFEVEMTDAIGRSVRQSYLLRIVPLPLTIAGTLPYAMPNTAYSETLTVSGGVTPYEGVVKVSGPSWAGVSMAGDTITVSGPAPTAQAGILSIKVTDNNGTPRTVDFVLSTKLTITGTFPDASNGIAYDNYIVITGGSGSYSNPRDTAGSHPSGLNYSISEVSSEWRLYLSGTSNSSDGSYDFDVGVDSSDGQEVTSAQTIAVSTTYESTVLSDAPVGYWKADEMSGSVLTDSSGNGNHGTYHLGSNVEQGSTPIRSGASASLQITSVGYAARTPPNLVLPAAGEPWTMEAIFSPVDAGGFNRTVFGTNGDDGAWAAQGISWRSNEAICVTANTSSSTRYYSPSGSAPVDTPVHVVWTSDGTTCSAYINGVYSGGFNYSSNRFSDHGGYLYLLGTASYPASYGYVGKGSDFAVYDHALSEARILKHAQVAGLAS